MSDYMHEELILEILKTLPVKSVVKCRSVCKKWNTLICHPSFVSAHLQASLWRPSDNTPFLLLTSEKKGCEKYYLHYDNDGFDEFKQLQIPLFGYVSEAPVVGCCNGLICLQLFSRSDCSYIYYFLWNPSIQMYISLPRLRIDKDAGYLCVGFGFDSRTNDYKLLLAGTGSDNCWMKPYLFSLNHKRWKRVTAVYPNYGFGPETLLPFVNGAVHWLGHQNRNDDKARNVILGFDLSAEVFFEMSLPESLIGLYPAQLSCMQCGESSIAVLAISWEGGRELHQLWVMKEYVVAESWTKVLAIRQVDNYAFIPWASGFRKNGDVLLRLGYGNLASLDLNCRKMELRGVKIAEQFISAAGSYVESLVLLDKVDARRNSDVDKDIDSRDDNDVYSDSDSVEFTRRE